MVSQSKALFPHSSLSHSQLRIISMSNQFDNNRNDNPPWLVQRESDESVDKFIARGLRTLSRLVDVPENGFDILPSVGEASLTNHHALDRGVKPSVTIGTGIAAHEDPRVFAWVGLHELAHVHDGTRPWLDLPLTAITAGTGYKAMNQVIASGKPVTGLVAGLAVAGAVYGMGWIAIRWSEELAADYRAARVMGGRNAVDALRARAKMPGVVQRASVTHPPIGLRAVVMSAAGVKGHLVRS